MSEFSPTDITVTIQYFAYLKDRFGCEQERLTLPKDANVADLKRMWLAKNPDEGATLDFVRVAVGDAYVDGEHILQADDEVAFLPPVSGGNGEAARPEESPVHVRLTSEAFAPGDAEKALKCTGSGATVTFRGIIRDNSEGRTVLSLSYEAKAEMALSLMKMERNKALARGDITDVAIWHRLGPLEVGDLGVEIAVSSPHRAASFEVARAIIEAFKTDIPIFKKETFADGAVEWKHRCHQGVPLK
jgi:molybdopterin converting factor subunit 1